MSIKLGIDIGTTNTVVSTIKNGKPEALKYFYNFFGENYDAIIPSVQLEEESKKTFGIEAIREFERIYEYEKEKLNQISLHYEYKMKMGHSVEAKDLTRDMIDYILDVVIQKEGNVDGIVVTVPHEWEPGTEGRYATEDALKQNIHRIPLLQIVSEPVAAAAYYAFIRKNRNYETVLVCDLGAGTQDYTLCEISSNNEIEILYNEGSDKSGGAYIDNRIVEELLKSYQGEVGDLDRYYLKLQAEAIKISANQEIIATTQENEEDKNFWKSLKIKDFFRLDTWYSIFNPANAIKNFWNKLKQKTKSLYESVAQLFKTKEEAESINFKDENLQFAYSKIPDATEGIANQVTEHVQKIIREGRERGHQIDTVVLAGGSSNNVLLQAKIQELIDLDFSTFEVDDWNYVISFGASLIAEDQIKVVERSKYNYGIKVKSDGEMIPFIILPQGTEYGKRQESKTTFRPLLKHNSKTDVIRWENSDNELKDIGSFVLEDSDKPQVRFAMSIDQKTGILVVECKYGANILKKQEYHGRKTV